MGLLNYITATSLDEDYAVAAKRSGPEPAAKNPGTVALVILAVFGILITTAAVQTNRGAEGAQTQHDELVAQINIRKEQLANRRERIRDLQSETETLQTKNLEATVEGRAVQSRLSRLGPITGADPVRGPGVEIVVDNGPPSSGSDGEVLDIDLQKMVNGLWLAGAEAIAINGQRLSNLSAVRLAGAAINVNYRPLKAPYTVTAIGDPDTLATRFIDTPGGQWWLDLRALYGLKFDINREESLTLPAASRIDLRHAHTPETLR